MGKSNLLNTGIDDFFARPNEKQAVKPPKKKENNKVVAPKTTIGLGRPRGVPTSVTAGKEFYSTSTRFVLDQYKIVDEIHRRDNLTIKDVLYLLLKEGISKWCKQHDTTEEELLDGANKFWPEA